VVTRAGVTDRDFYRIFKSSEECYLAAFDEGLARLSQVLADSAGREQDWLARVRAGLLALLGFLDAEPRWGRLLIIQTPIAQRRVFERRQRAVSALAAVLDEHEQSERVRVEARGQVVGLTGELIVRGVLSLIEARMLSGNCEPLTGLAATVMAFILTPYVGVVAASLELEQASANSNTQHAAYPPLAVRTTYRTSRVLRAISTTPRSSNREIAEAAGLTDEGQTSKLLTRLERRGLIENIGLGALHGEPNAWLLTPLGRRVVKAIGHGLEVDATVRGARRIRGPA
jgi:AcrR family transcriptional regulator